VEWHIITGEYPPKWGGVSDYTYQITKELARVGDCVHVWSPETQLEVSAPSSVEVHALPGGFGWRWLRALQRQLGRYPSPRNILIQYVPHMYGWKSMNLAFCLWICRQKKHNVCVMFHEVAYPFRDGQRIRHSVLAITHRIMAWAILRSVRHSFTSTEPYMALLRNLGGQQTPISLLRICSNIPMESYGRINSSKDRSNDLFTVGIFSNFNDALRESLEPAIECLLGDPGIKVVLLGPGESFAESLSGKNPQAASRIQCTGHLHVTEVGERMRRCDALLQLYPDGASAARGTLIGAMASGVPVVTVAGPATDQLLLDSGSLLFPDGSPESVRDAVELLRENPTLAHEVAARARRLYEESFQPSVIISTIRATVVGLDGCVEALAKPEPALQR
jgi:glycosyltransferase involved in cell wall biosynthesis